MLRLSQKALSGTASGKLVNLLSNDVLRFDNMHIIHPLWISPTISIIATYLLWREIQWAGMIGVALILLFSPVQSKQKHFFFQKTNTFNSLIRKKTPVHQSTYRLYWEAIGDNSFQIGIANR